MEWSLQKRRNTSSRWHLPENCASIWMQQACSQQRILAEARQKTAWRSSERCLREALAKLGDKSTRIPHLQPKYSCRTRPRQLTPLTVKPSAAIMQDKEHAIHQLQQSELKLRVPKMENSRRRGGAIANSAPKSPLLAIPLHPVASTTSNSGSSSANSPLPDTTPFAATLSAQSKESVLCTCTAKQSPPTQRKGRLSPLILASQGSKNKQAPYLFLQQRTPSPYNITFCGKQNPPFISPVSPINPKPRPAIPTIKTRNLSPYAIRQKPKRRKVIAAEKSTAVAESEAKAANADQALSAAPIPPNRGAPHEVSTTSGDADRSHNRLTIPEITIRFPTPAPTENNHYTFVVPVIAIRAATPVPGEVEESLTNLRDQFVFRAELVEELGMLKNDLQHLSGDAASEKQ